MDYITIGKKQLALELLNVNIFINNQTTLVSNILRFCLKIWNISKITCSKFLKNLKLFMIKKAQQLFNQFYEASDSKKVY